jgi:hypothetical protein
MVCCHISEMLLIVSYELGNWREARGFSLRGITLCSEGQAICVSTKVTRVRTCLHQWDAGVKEDKVYGSWSLFQCPVVTSARSPLNPSLTRKAIFI